MIQMKIPVDFGREKRMVNSLYRFSEQNLDTTLLFFFDKFTFVPTYAPSKINWECEKVRKGIQVAMTGDGKCVIGAIHYHTAAAAAAASTRRERSSTHISQSP